MNNHCLSNILIQISNIAVLSLHYNCYQNETKNSIHHNQSNSYVYL